MTAKNRRVLVTGSSKGIGRSIALRLAEAGFKVTVHYNSDRESALKTASEIGANTEILQFDVADRDKVKAELEKSLEARGAFYGAVLNAGIYRDGPFPGLSEEDWDLVLRSNLDGFYNVLHPLVMPMIRLREGGRIAAITSISGITGNRGQVNYSASKAGLIGAAKALSKELAKRGITVNCVAPGVIESAMTEKLPVEEYLKAIPMERFGKPEEVAALVNFLFSDEAAYITSQVISINGGLI